MIDESVKEDFLAQWPQNRRATIMNQVLESIRKGGAKCAAQMIEWLRVDVERRLASAYTEADARAAQVTLRGLLSEPGMTPMCNYCLWWESLSYEQKQKIKQARGTGYAKQAMAGQQPTDRQLKYLAALGCTDMPTSKAQASEWIDSILNKQNASKAS